MLIGLSYRLGTLALGQGSDGGVLGVTVAVAVVGVALGLLAWTRLRSTRRLLGTALHERDETHDALKSLQSRERELTKKADERQEELRELKQEVAGLRKKNHAAHEEMKALRLELRAQADERDRLLAVRPAFEPVAAKTEPRPKPKVAARPAGEAPRAASAPAAEAAAPIATAPTSPAEPDNELATRVVRLEAERASLTVALEAERESLKTHKAELARLRRYSEQLRRIDMVSKGKVEVLEDKVASLGRQYYETVSELAALKGQVVPPRSRSEVRRRGNATAQAAEVDDEGHATPETDALSAQMDAADDEAQVSHHEAGAGGTVSRASEA